MEIVLNELYIEGAYLLGEAGTHGSQHGHGSVRPIKVEVKDLLHGVHARVSATAP